MKRRVFLVPIRAITVIMPFLLHGEDSITDYKHILKGKDSFHLILFSESAQQLPV